MFRKNLCSAFPSKGQIKVGKTGCCGSLLDSWLWYVCKGQMKAECEIRVYYTSVCSDVMDDSDLSFDVSCDAVPTSERVFLS